MLHWSWQRCESSAAHQHIELTIFVPAARGNRPVNQKESGLQLHDGCCQSGTFARPWNFCSSCTHFCLESRPRRQIWRGRNTLSIETRDTAMKPHLKVKFTYNPHWLFRGLLIIWYFRQSLPTLNNLSATLYRLILVCILKFIFSGPPTAPLAYNHDHLINE